MPTLNPRVLPGDSAWTILDNDCTGAEIQDALDNANYNIVYLLGGLGSTNDLGNVNISVPAQKSLIGLGGIIQGTGTGVDLNIIVDATHRVQLGAGSLLKNIKLRFDATSTAGNEMIETGTNEGVVIEGVTVDGSAVAAGTGILSNAIVGRVKKVTHCEFNKCWGLYISSSSTDDEGGEIEVSYIHHDGIAANNNSYNTAINNISTNVTMNTIHAENGYGAVYNNANYCKITNVLAESVGQRGLYCNGNYNNIEQITVNTSGAYGVYIEGDYANVDQVDALNTQNIGVYFNGNTSLEYGSFSNVTTYNCALAASISISIYKATECAFSSFSTRNAHLDAIQFNECNSCVVTNMNIYNPSRDGFRFVQAAVARRNTISGINVYSAASEGAIFEGSESQVSNVNTIDNTSHGILWKVLNGSLTGVTTNGNGGDGISVDATVDGGTITGVFAEGNTSDGIDIAAGVDKLFISSVQTVNNGGWGILGGEPGAGKVNTLMGHTSDGDTAGARSLTAVAGTWNSGSVW